MKWCQPCERCPLPNPLAKPRLLTLRVAAARPSTAVKTILHCGGGLEWHGNTLGKQEGVFGDCGTSREGGGLMLDRDSCVVDLVDCSIE